MSTFIGVTSSLHLGSQYLVGLDPLKREALIFDKIALCDYDFYIQNVEGFLQSEMADVNWLIERGIIVHPKELIPSNVIETERSKALHAAIHLRLVTVKSRDDLKSRQDVEEFLLDSLVIQDIQIRMTSSLLHSSAELDTYPISIIGPSLEESAGSNEVVEVILNHFPIPDESVSWEQILDFRNDPDSRRKFFALRDWFSDLTQKNAKPKEVEEKLEFLMSEYRNHINIHRMKTRLESLKTIVLAEAGFITGGWITGHSAIAGILGMVVSPFFTLTQRRVTLMEEEQKAPGKEVAYILNAIDTFQKPTA